MVLASHENSPTAAVAAMSGVVVAVLLLLTLKLPPTMTETLLSSRLNGPTMQISAMGSACLGNTDATW